MCQEDADIGFTRSGNGLTGTVNLVNIAKAHRMDAPSVSIFKTLAEMQPFLRVNLRDTFRVYPYEGGVLEVVWPPSVGTMTMCHEGPDGFHIGLQLQPGQTEGQVCGA
jgi:hypothetical protein